MIEKKEVKILIEGGKATASPPLGPALGPLGVNISKIVDEINQKTKEMSGMQVPVTVSVNPETKEYEIEIGTPPTAELIKKEAGIEKGSSNPKTDMVANLKMEQIIKIAKIKESTLSGKTIKEKVKEILGTCNSMGVMVENKKASDIIKEVDRGRYDEEIGMKIERN